MAKPRKPIGQAAQKGVNEPSDDVRRAEEKLRDRYRIGKEALAANTENTTNDGKSIQRLATENRVSTSEIRQARLFARNYTEEEFEALLLLRCKGLPFTWDHVKELAKVTTKTRRAELQDEVAKKSWSVRKLRMAIKARTLDRSKSDKARRAGGRRHAPPSSPPVALVQILALSNQWSRYYVDSGVGGSDSPLKELSGVSRKERQARRQQILETKNALVELGASISSVLKQIERSRREIEKAEREDKKLAEAEPDKAGSAKTPPRRSRKAKSRSKIITRKIARRRPST